MLQITLWVINQEDTQEVFEKAHLLAKPARRCRLVSTLGVLSCRQPAAELFFTKRRDSKPSDRTLALLG